MQNINRMGYENQVLIVPLWNRNGGSRKGHAHGVGSNRTFMELKYQHLESKEKRS